jgi:opacity protein-like surface antigen
LLAHFAHGAIAMTPSPHIHSTSWSRLAGHAAVRAISLLVIAALAAVCHPARAADRGYVGLRAGISDDNLSEDERSGIGELFGGLRIGRNWAVELGLFGTHKDLGRITDHEGRTLENGLDLRGAALSARYTVPLTERANLHLRGGIANFDLSYRSTLTQTSTSDPDPRTIRYAVDGNNFGGVVAVGVDFAIGTRWRLGAELQHYRGDLRLGHDGGSVFVNAFNRSGSLQALSLSAVAEF